MPTFDIARSASVDLTGQPSLAVNSDPGEQGSVGVGVFPLDPDFMISLGQYTQTGGALHSILRVTVVPTEARSGDDLPDVLGRYQVLEDEVRFVPHFPFERGLSYRASFDPRPLGHPEFTQVLTHEFSLPKDQAAFPTDVTRIFPATDDLPENLLRFYVCFSSPMQRGRAEAEISLLASDGEPAPDVLYRAPVELWDRSMQCLTILLDPGRLKRGVGPNRRLGPPLKAGQMYMLAIGAGMTDIFGGQLAKNVYKRFRVTDAVREPIAVERWKFVPPLANSRQPLVLMFPRPLDWAMLFHAIAIESTSEQSIDGAIEIDQNETRWSFTPTSTWAADDYQIRIASSLEDICGNSVTAAFDRPLRSGSDLAYEAGNRSIPFHVAPVLQSHIAKEGQSLASPILERLASAQSVGAIIPYLEI